MLLSLPGVGLSARPGSDQQSRRQGRGVEEKELRALLGSEKPPCEALAPDLLYQRRVGRRERGGRAAGA